MFREIFVLVLKWARENRNGKRADLENNDKSKARRYENKWLRYEEE